MQTKDLIMISRHTILAQKLRTTLSMLGIIIGVITIILVGAIGSGAQQQVQAQFKNLSVDTIMIFPTRGMIFTQEDIDLIQSSPYIQSVAGFYQGNSTISSEQESTTFSVLGISESIFTIVSLQAQAGGLIQDEMDKDKDVVLGHGAMTQLFPNVDAQDIIGQSISINKKSYTIIGVLKKAGGGFGPLSFDDSVYVPLKTFEKYIARGERNSPQLRITALAKETSVVSKAVEDITNIINQQHKLEEDESRFRVIDAGSTVSTAQENAKTLKYLLIGIASIVLLVSGIGIMNVMFASVAERTKEIGILKSIGADQRSILSQFLLESIILTSLGSIIGVVVGELIIALNPFGSTLPLHRTLRSDIIAVIFAVVTGLFFGWYPARKASQMDPVDALRV